MTERAEPRDSLLPGSSAPPGMPRGPAVPPGTHRERAPDAPPRRGGPSGGRRVLRVLVRMVATVGALAVLWVAACLWLLPALALRQLQARGTEALGVPVRADALEIDPFTLRLRLAGLRMGDLGELDGLLLRPAWRRTLSARAPVLADVTLRGLTLRVERRADGGLDIDPVLARLAARPKTESPMPAFAVERLRLEDATLRWTDRPTGLLVALTGLDASVEGVSTLPGERERPLEPVLKAGFHLRALATPEAAVRAPAAAGPSSAPPAPAAARTAPSGSPSAVTQAAVTPPSPNSQTGADAPLNLRATLRGFLRDDAPRTATARLELRGADLLPLRALAPLPVRLEALPAGLDLRVDAELPRDAPPRLKASAEAKLDGTALADPDGAWRLRLPLLRLRAADLAWPAPGALKVGGKDARLALDARAADGETLRLTARPDADGNALRGQAALTEVSLPRWWVLAGAQPVRPLGGALGFGTEFVLALPAGRSPAVSLANGEATVEGLSLAATRDGRPLGAIRRLEASGLALDTAARDVRLALLDAEGLALALERDNAGRLQPFSSLRADVSRDATAPTAAGDDGTASAPSGLPASPSADAATDSVPAASSGAAAPPVPRPGAGAWSWRVDRVLLRRGAVALSDARTLPATRLNLNVERAALDGLSGDPTAPLALDAKLRAGGGTLTLAGRGTRAPAPAGTLDVDLRGFDALAMAPLWTPRIGPRVDRLRLSATGRVTLEADGRVGWRGQAEATDLLARDPADASDLLRWKTLRLTGLDVGTRLDAPDPAGPGALRLHAGEVLLDRFFARVVIRPDGKLNLQDLGRRDTGATPAVSTSSVSTPAVPPVLAGSEASRASGAPGSAGAPDGSDTPAVASGEVPGHGGRQEGDARRAGDDADPPGGLPRDLRVGRIVLRDGTVAFTDLFIRPNYSADLRDVEGTITALQPGRPGEVALRAKLEGNAPVSLSGQADPLSPELFLDLAGEAKGVPLSPLSPYALRYAGYGITGGSLSMTVRYRIREGQLQADNALRLERLRFGERGAGPEATSLPIPFLVSLLQDRDGNIELDLPIRGTLDDPEFSFGAVAGRAVRNLVGRILSAPFAWLGGRGRGGEVTADDAALSRLRMDPAQAVPSAEQASRLDTLAKLMIDRPALGLDVVGQADDSDRTRLADAAFERRLAEARARLPGADRAALLRDALRQLQPPAGTESVDTLLTDVPVEDLERRLRDAIVVEDAALRELAATRASAVHDALVARGVPAGRLRTATDAELDGSGVQFRLRPVEG